MEMRPHGLYLKTHGEKTKIGPICHHWPTGHHWWPIGPIGGRQSSRVANRWSTPSSGGRPVPNAPTLDLDAVFVLVSQEVQGKVTVEFKFSLWKLETMLLVIAVRHLLNEVYLFCISQLFREVNWKVATEVVSGSPGHQWPTTTTSSRPATIGSRLARCRPSMKFAQCVGISSLSQDLNKLFGDLKARVLEQMGEIRSVVEMTQLEAEKKHDEVVDEMLAMLNAKAEVSRLKEVEQEVRKDVDEEQKKLHHYLAMAVSFSSVNSQSGLKKLDEYLLTRSYITGYQASKDDITVHAALSKPPPSEFVNASRWYNHIEALLRISGVSGEGCGVTIEGSAPVIEEAIATPPVADTKASLSMLACCKFASAAEDDDDDDDVDLFGEETEEEKKAAEERAAAMKASGKKKESGKSSILMDIKPWDDETDMKKLEEAVRSVQMEGLVWGASKLVPVGYGIKKLQILLSIVDDLVSVDTLIEDYLTAEPVNEYVQSCDIVAFNKI
ncbi:hypothetical protein HYC85_004444 [Camellia sinensis]|uniref:Translation elongation factor EF1B beta/delta subunit guanine nucleotide exchange domain-containing protein n=1 Tax=Camellia sinensis TaxID=4442 RepID=A0A7J7HX74_CAMSI|nr:hypothetical protein HYC85_004444 [Camellia sinensis]